VLAGGGDEPVEVAHGVADLLGGQVVGVGPPAAGPLPRMHLDQLAVVEQLDQGRVGSHVQVLSDVDLRRGVQCPADLQVEVSVDLHVLNTGTS